MAVDLATARLATARDPAEGPRPTEHGRLGLAPDVADPPSRFARAPARLPNGDVEGRGPAGGGRRARRGRAYGLRPAVTDGRAPWEQREAQEGNGRHPEGDDHFDPRPAGLRERQDGEDDHGEHLADA